MEFSDSVSSKYTGLIEKFGEETIDARYRSIIDRMTSWISEHGLQKNIRIDRILLQNAVLDYYSDISRLKDYHNIETTNSVKVIAYEVYWLWRRRPLQVISNPYEESSNTAINDILVFCNEYFALSEISLFLYNDIDDITFSNAFKDKSSHNSSFIKTLLYHLKFRHCNAQFFELVLWAFIAAKELSDVSYDTPPNSDPAQ